jgi:hypothetical protein
MSLSFPLAFHSEFPILYSAFRIPHSAFRIPHSAFRIPHSLPSLHGGGKAHIPVGAGFILPVLPLIGSDPVVAFGYAAARNPTPTQMPGEQ